MTKNNEESTAARLRREAEYLGNITLYARGEEILNTREVLSAMVVEIGSILSRCMFGLAELTERLDKLEAKINE